jgi:hypothetical protein
MKRRSSGGRFGQNDSRQLTCLGVFVTRLQSSTTANDINKHVCRETGLIVKSEKLKTKFSTYASFCIPGNLNQNAKLLISTVWPKGCLVKAFYTKM